MNTNITFEYPTWFILLCLLLGLAYALILYFRSKTFKEQSPLLTWGLGILRFLSVSTIAILLLAPFIKSLQSDIKKPIIVLAQDQSESIALDLKDTAAYQTAFKDLKSKLEEKYDVKEYAFGDEVREGVDFQFKDKVSNLSDVLKEMYDLYSDQNLGAIVLASDGIYNEGSNPIYAGTKLNAPIYTIALGDTTPKKDLILKRVFHNKIAYLGDKFGIQADVTAQNCLGASTVLQVFKVDKGQKPKKLQEFPIKVNEKDFFTTQEIILNADQSGVQRYRVQVAAVNGEVTRVNNVQDIFVDILDARQKILVLANAPHPDIAALRQIISKNKNYEVKVDYISNPRQNIPDFNFVILHQIPSTNVDVTSILKKINDAKLPRLFILGNQSNLAVFNKAQSILSVSGNTRNTNEVQSNVSNNFDVFIIDERVKKEFKRFPPLIAPFGEFSAAPDAEVLMYQKIGNVDTQYPLMVFGEEEGNKVGVIAAEGIWKWRMFDYLQHQNHEVFEELFGKLIQYLTLKEDKRKFRVSVSKSIFNENESVTFDAELYNESYELINEPDVSLTITNSQGKDFNYTFNKTDKAYILDAGLLAAGNYSFEGKVNVKGQQLSYKGQFSVRPIQLEIFETTANHNLMKQLGERFGGHSFYETQLPAIADSIAAKGTIKPVYYDTLKTRSVINLKWLFFLILFLLSLEWFLRKYFGAY